jgi:hypothetical protein
MAILIYRFEYQGPTQGEVEVGVTGTVSAGPIIGQSIQRDWTFDDSQTNPDDLVETLAESGWVFISDVT